MMSRQETAAAEVDDDRGYIGYCMEEEASAWESADDSSSMGTSVAENNTTPITPMPRLVRPVPRHTVQVVRPVPQRASERFYRSAHEAKATLEETHDAVLVARDWHRKWTQQDERGHISTQNDFYDQRPGDQEEEIVFFRQGAKNPSISGSQSQEDVSSLSSDGFLTSGNGAKRCHGLTVARLPPSRNMNLSPVGSEGDEDDDELHQMLILNPNDRLSCSTSSSGSSSASSAPILAPQLKRRFVGRAPSAASVGEETEYTEDDDDSRGMMEPVLRPVRPIPQPIAIRPLVVRPVRPTAMRVVRPTPVHPTPFQLPNQTVPKNIFSTMASNEISPVSFLGGVSYIGDSPFASEGVVVGPPSNQQTEVENFPVHVIEVDEDEQSQVCFGPVLPPEIAAARQNLLHSLAVTQGDVDSDLFQQSLRGLIERSYKTFDIDTRGNTASPDDPRVVEGMWLTLSKPNYFASLGQNDNGDPMYTLGRMSFDMFSPTNLVCSLQGNFNPVEVVSDEERKTMLEKVPKKLREEVESGKTILRTYHVVAAFTIEPNLAAFPNSPNKDVHRPIRGIMTTFGYSLPDPNVVNRHSIWFTGGRIEPNDDPSDIAAWKRLFAKHPPKHTFGEKAKLLAVKLLMGATVPDSMANDGSMQYAFTRPLGGHGMAYVDVVYIDSNLRIVRGQRGTIFVFSRLEGDGKQPSDPYLKTPPLSSIPSLTP